MIFRLAGRNIWRNKRRTLITVASIMFAVLFSSTLQSLQQGAWDNVLGNILNSYYGYVQIHKSGYWEERSIDKAFSITEEIRNIPASVPEVQGMVPRLESYALASYGTKTKGSIVIGIDPEIEDKMTGLRKRLVQGKGEYLEAEEKALLVSEGLADNMKLSVGDTLVLISMGYHGVNAAGKYPVKGIVSFGSPELNKQLIYIPLKEAGWFYGAEELVTSVVLMLNSEDDINTVVKKVKSKIGTEEYEIMDFEEMIPDMVEARALDSAGNYIVYFILYIIIAFGLYGTILMMTRERQYEFGILISIGMNRTKLFATVWLEILMMALVGVIAGIAVSTPIVLYFQAYPIRFTGQMAEAFEKFSFEPILPAIFSWQIFFVQAIIVFIMTSLLAIYPFFKIRKMKVVQAMKG